ncbi:fumarylacetoacetate hydrolase family protein [Alcaligenaceae bacterium CGII-47]|nr:fumarylacetoacetate hydrolase family protein [Alcaligenaceae bacterium CGII-47]
MKFSTLTIDGAPCPVVIDDQRSIYWAVRDLIPGFSGTLLDIIEDYAKIEKQLASLPDSGSKLDMSLLCAPIPRPRRNIFCVGLNYRAHADEVASTQIAIAPDKNDKTKPNTWPIIFTKMPECVIGPNDAIELPRAISEQIDYEAELAVIIGTGGKNIQAKDAMSHVFGFTVSNDVTSRDVQARHKQWVLGKSFDTFCPMGPWIVTADELIANNAEISCWVNNELRQQSNTGNMIFDIPTLIETCSRGLTLYPGDIILTGTPAGVGMAMTPPKYLESGDTVRVEIKGIGVLENTCK